MTNFFPQARAESHNVHLKHAIFEALLMKPLTLMIH
jgi:hypothetical protein